MAESIVFEPESKSDRLEPPSRKKLVSSKPAAMAAPFRGNK